MVDESVNGYTPTLAYCQRGLLIQIPGHKEPYLFLNSNDNVENFVDIYDKSSK